jgi:hypothetical protein
MWFGGRSKVILAAKVVPFLAATDMKGMAAWMQACIRWTPPSERRSVPSSSTGPEVPSGLRGELVVVLIAMVLSQLQEVGR